MEVLFDTLLITQDSESVLFYAVAGLYNLSNDASFAQMAARKPGVLAKLHSLNESANPDRRVRLAPASRRPRLPTVERAAFTRCRRHSTRLRTAAKHSTRRSTTTYTKH